MDQVTQVKTQLRLEHWKQLISECQASGMPVCSWCKEHNVSEPSYYYYLKRLRQQAIQTLPLPLPTEKETSTVFQKLEVVPNPVLPTTSPAVILRLSQATLEIAEGTSQQTVQAVLLALQSIC